MAYDRHDTRDHPRSERSRWREDRFERGTRDRDWGDDDRGFFDRAGDEIASWFGDEEAERRRRDDRMRDERDFGRDRGEGRGRFFGSDRDEDRGRFWRERSWDRGDFERDEDRGRSFGRERFSGREGRDRDRGYRPMTGDYGRAEHGSGQFFAASGMPRGGRGEEDRSSYRRSQSPWGRDEYRRTSRAGTSDWSDRSRHEDPRDRDPHYSSWRQRHMDELDRDYDDYRRENRARFEDDFGSWRERRQQKRGLLGSIREHMEVVGSDDQRLGTVERVAGDRIILQKSDPEGRGGHHSLSCSDIDRVEGDRVILDCPAEQARERWRDESRSRALFEREDQGEMGPRMLDRSFEGTYR